MPSQACIFLVRDHPADHVTTEQIKDHVEIQIEPASDSRQLGNVPGVDLVRRSRFQLRLGMMLYRAPDYAAPGSLCGA